MYPHSHSIENHRHSHIFLGTAHERNERKTWTVIAICAVMMVAEIAGGVWFGSVALVADGLHMSTHAGALLIAALAYTYSRRYATDRRLTFGTGKLSDYRIAEIVQAEFDMRPGAFRRYLDLHRPIFQKTAAYGHFGRADDDFTWEKTDRADALREAAGAEAAAA